MPRGVDVPPRSLPSSDAGRGSSRRFGGGRDGNRPSLPETARGGTGVVSGGRRKDLAWGGSREDPSSHLSPRPGGLPGEPPQPTPRFCGVGRKASAPPSPLLELRLSPALSLPSP